MELPEPLIRAVRENRLQHSDIGMWIALRIHLSDESGLVTASLNEIADATGAGRRGVVDTLRRLHAAGVVVYRPTDTRFRASVVELVGVSSIGAKSAPMEQPPHQGKSRTDGGSEQGISDADFGDDVPTAAIRNITSTKKVKGVKGQGIGRGEGKQRRRFDHEADEYKLAVLLLDGIRRVLDPQRRTDERQLQEWADHIRLLHERNGRSYEEIGRVIKWLHNDGSKEALFWRKVTLSGRKLRSNFDSLYVQARPYLKHLEAARARATTKDCPTCEGAGVVLNDEGGYPCPNPDCKNGKVPV